MRESFKEHDKADKMCSSESSCHCWFPRNDQCLSLLAHFYWQTRSFYISTSADSERLRSYRGPVTVDLNLPETVAFAVTLCFECLAAVGIKSCCKLHVGLQQLSGMAWAPHATDWPESVRGRVRVGGWEAWQW